VLLRSRDCQAAVVLLLSRDCEGAVAVRAVVVPRRLARAHLCFTWWVFSDGF
jgi:hypothetical protein